MSTMLQMHKSRSWTNMECRVGLWFASMYLMCSFCEPNHIRETARWVCFNAIWFYWSIQPKLLKITITVLIYVYVSFPFESWADAYQIDETTALTFSDSFGTHVPYPSFWAHAPTYSSFWAHAPTYSSFFEKWEMASWGGPPHPPLPGSYSFKLIHTVLKLEASWKQFRTL
jgi:hypothetical protein